jgi:MSHA biogenesis protein MshJ
MSKLGFQVKRFQGWLDQRAPRERLLILVAALSVVVFFLYLFVVAPQQNEQQRLRERAVSIKEQTESVRKQVREIEQTYGRAIDETGTAQIEALRAQLKAADPALAEVARSLVSPKEMADLVEQVLRQNRALELVSIENLPVSPLGDAPPVDPAAQVPVTDEPATIDAGTGFYKHGLVIEVRGRYTEIVGYLRTLENLPWKVFWGQVTLVAEDYPISRARLVVYTLSLNPKWIGI